MPNTNNIGAFISVETFIDDSNEPLESSVDIGVENIFKEHLRECKSNVRGLENLDLFKVKVGDKLYIHRSEGSINFIKKYLSKEDIDNYTDKQYLVENIQIDFYSVNPHKDTNLPLIKIAVFLKNI